MTCKEQYIKDHPDLSKESVELVMRNMCPHDYGYLDEAYWCNGRNDDNCKKCWNRKIPEDDKNKNEQFVYEPFEYNPPEYEDLCLDCSLLKSMAKDGKKTCPKVPRLFAEKIIKCEHRVPRESEFKKFKEAGEAFAKGAAEGLKGASAATKAFVERFNEAAAKMSKYSGAFIKDNNEEVIKEPVDVTIGDIPLRDISSESLGLNESGAIAYGKIKDSGARIQFATGAVTDSHDGKGRCDLMPLDVVAGFRGQILNDIYDYQTSGDPKYLKIALQKFIDRYMKDMSTALLEVSIHFEEGAKKYGEHNWQKGIPTHRHIDSAVRHYLKFMRGDKDEPHDRAFIWRLLCCIWTCIHKPELNDYSKENKEYYDEI